jgi:flagellar basal-body rod protein FlgF
VYYGIAISTSGLLTSLYRTDALSNNLANINTTGFKPDMVFTRQRDPVRQEDGVMSLPSNRMLERLGAGLQIAPNRVNHKQGALEATGNDLDVALQGDGFFVVRGRAGEGGDGVMLTRDGRMQLDQTNRLINANTGLPVLDPANRPIVLDPSVPVGIDGSGVVSQNGEVVARIQIADVPDRTQLSRAGEGMFRPGAGTAGSIAPGTARVRQGHIESSAVSPVNAMLQTTKAASSVGSHVRLIDMQDRMMDRAINTLGRTA